MNAPQVCFGCDRPEFTKTVGSSVQMWQGRGLVIEGVERWKCACGAEVMDDAQIDLLGAKVKEQITKPRAF